MADVSSVEFDHCRELALRPGTTFEFTSRYLQSVQFNRLLALYALKQAIASIPESRVDDAVKWAKLKWWSEELLADPLSPSRHPVLRALSLSGARTGIGKSLLLGLVSDALRQIDAAPGSDEDDLFERFSASGAHGFRLELALDDAAIEAKKLGFVTAASGVFQLVSSFAPDHVPQVNHLPMNMMAKYNLTTSQLEQGAGREQLPELLTQLAGLGQGWYAEGLAGLNVSSKTRTETGLCAHLRLLWAMQQRRLSEIRKDPGGFLQAGKRFGPADAWFAWRFLRQIS